MKSHIDWGEEQQIPCKGVKTENPKRIMCVSGGLELLQMLSEPDTKRPVSENTGSQEGRS